MLYAGLRWGYGLSARARLIPGDLGFQLVQASARGYKDIAFPLVQARVCLRDIAFQLASVFKSFVA